MRKNKGGKDLGFDITELLSDLSFPTQGCLWFKPTEL